MLEDLLFKGEDPLKVLKSLGSSVLMITPFIIIVPSNILDFLEINEYFETILGKLYPSFFNILNNFNLF